MDCRVRVRVQQRLSISTHAILRASVRNVKRVREKKKLIKKSVVEGANKWPKSGLHAKVNR